LVDNLTFVLLMVWLLVVIITEILNSYYNKKGNPKNAKIAKRVYWISSAIYVITLLIYYRYYPNLQCQWFLLLDYSHNL
jgi:membrane protein insertase Oxa1/YidC/SpoIIIJ